ncbi:MAG: sigma 54-interacting transcriptional regulator [Desulfomonile tiedjei]|uniref:Sigma 54-interacting transcriptional regulator n=1 Tax=Desulfomonile tiedjei TaxID=2358 RepID=A0A9D6Z5R2_9BACT|nr:sigma 54-interacting transcriptional regulator [Desulfomonile tiedjei]
MLMSRLNSEVNMRWTLEARYRILLKINNAIITRMTREKLFRSLAAEMYKHFRYDRLSINLYDIKTESLSYFAAADGIEPEGISGTGSRPLAKGSIAQMVIGSGRPVIIADLANYQHLPSVPSMLDSGLRATMAFPLMVRSRILGTIHFSFKKTPDYLSELAEVLTDVSKQVAIAVDNMMAYTELKSINENLERQKRFLLANSGDAYRPDHFFFAAPSMAQIMGQLRLVADTDVPVLITGETGTGKDCLARTIHDLSSRRDHLFVKINCPALAASLFESELFGHGKGAFTGADVQRIGRFEMADKGTVFLDEVGDLPANLQAKMLHVLQDGVFERVGETQPIEANFRVIAATNHDMEESIRVGAFRRDLYYRLNTVTIHIPPLKDRPEDIPLLVEQLTSLEANQIKRPAPEYTVDALERLCQYHWPGNVRELKNFVKRMIILRPSERITDLDIEKILNPFQPETDKGVTTLADAERQHIERALIKCAGVVGGPNGVARMLGIPRSTLQYRLKKLGLDPSDYITRKKIPATPGAASYTKANILQE